MASGDTLCVFLALDAVPATTNYATQDLRNLHPVLDFDASTEESVYFEDVLPRHYGGSGLSVNVTWMATSATTATVVWGSSIERQDSGTDLDADSFATEQTTATATSGTSGAPNTTTVTHSSGANMDSLAAGEPFRLKIARKVNDASDTMTGDAELFKIEIKET